MKVAQIKLSLKKPMPKAKAMAHQSAEDGPAEDLFGDEEESPQGEEGEDDATEMAEDMVSPEQLQALPDDLLLAEVKRRGLSLEGDEGGDEAAMMDEEG